MRVCFFSIWSILGRFLFYLTSLFVISPAYSQSGLPQVDSQIYFSTPFAYSSSFGEVFFLKGKHELVRREIETGLEEYFTLPPFQDIIALSTNGLDLFLIDKNVQQVIQLTRKFFEVAVVDFPPPSLGISVWSIKDLAVSRQGDLFVLESLSKVILKINTFNKSDVRVIGQVGEKGGGYFLDPVGLVVSHYQKLFVSDVGLGQVLAFDVWGTYLGRFGEIKKGSSTQVGQLSVNGDLREVVSILFGDVLVCYETEFPFKKILDVSLNKKLKACVVFGKRLIGLDENDKVCEIFWKER